MPKKLINTNHIAPPGNGYSRCLRAGDFIFVSGTLSTDRQDMLVGTTIEDQTRHTLDNIKEMLKAAGASLDDVVKATVYLNDYRDFEGYNKVYISYFSDPKPTRITCGVNLLKGVLIEIEVVAYTGK